MTSPIGGPGPRTPLAGLDQERGFRVDLGTVGSGESFGATLKRALEDVSQLQDRAYDAIAAFVRGEPVELHQVMAATEEAGIALELLIEIRNKLTEAYRAVVSMQS